MKILMEKRKNGIYVDRYIVEGEDLKGRKVYFPIYSEQANTFSKAIKFWKKHFSQDHIAVLIRHSEPISEDICYAA